jgi:DNA-binding NtrC family response regulator
MTKVNLPKILLVEDHEDLRGLVSAYLRNELPVMVKSLDSGNSAIEELKNGEVYDFIVSDFIMHNGTGADLLQYMAEQKISTPTVLFTNTINPQLQRTPLSYIGIVEKLKLEKLRELIRETLL